MPYGSWERRSSKIRMSRRRRKIQLIKRVGSIILMLALVFAGMLLVKAVMKSPEDSHVNDSSKGKPSGEKGNVADTDSKDTVELPVKKEETMMEKIQNNPSLYPENLRKLLERNEETIQFVFDYPEKKDVVPAESIGEVTEGEIPLLIQWDERWGYSPYGDDMIGMSGCGPTVLSMIVSGLTGDDTITPYKVARYAQENGFYVAGVGTSWTLMSQGVAHFGIQSKEVVLGKKGIERELSLGHPIICSVRAGDFTQNGHFIVLTGVEDGKIRVNDPNSRVKSNTLWDYERLEPQINGLWAFWK